MVVLTFFHIARCFFFVNELQQSRQDACVAVDLQPRTGSMVSCGFDGMVWSTWRSIVVTGDETWWIHDGTMDDWRFH